MPFRFLPHFLRATGQCLCGVQIQRSVWYSPKKGMSPDWLAFLQQPIDFRWVSIQNWIEKTKWKAVKKNENYIPERHQILGPDLAAAHFIIARGGAVRPVGHDKWVELTKDRKVPLGSKRVAKFYLEAIDTSNTNIMYHSFDNLVDLEHLKYLNLSRCEQLTDWCLDRLVQFRDTLLYLDISDCPQITERGLATLHKLHKLRRLKAVNLHGVRCKPLVGILLEESLPECMIEGLDYTTVDGQDLEQDEEQSPYIRKMEELTKAEQNA